MVECKIKIETKLSGNTKRDTYTSSKAHWLKCGKGGGGVACARLHLSARCHTLVYRSSSQSANARHKTSVVGKIRDSAKKKKGENVEWSRDDYLYTLTGYTHAPG